MSPVVAKAEVSEGFVSEPVIAEPVIAASEPLDSKVEEKTSEQSALCRYSSESLH